MYLSKDFLREGNLKPEEWDFKCMGLNEEEILLIKVIYVVISEK